MYLRGSLGAGIPLVSQIGASSDDGSIAPLLGISLGGAVSPGFAVGFGMQAAVSGVGGDGSLIGFGPLFDFYPDPRSGFHVAGALLFTSMKLSLSRSPAATCTDPLFCSSSSTDYRGAGLGLSGGVGYDTWLGRRTSVGVLLGVQFFAGQGYANDSTVPPVFVNVAIPGISVDLTYW